MSKELWKVFAIQEQSALGRGSWGFFGGQCGEKIV